MDCMEILNSWLTTIFGTAAGFLLALYTNRLIAKNSEKKKTIQEKQIKLAHLNYLKSVLEGIVDLIAKQSRHYSDFSDEIKASPYEILEPKIPASFDLLRLRNLDNAVTQEAYFTLFANNLVTVQNYETLFAHGDYMYRVFNSTEKQIYRAAKFKHKDQLEIRDNLLEASTLLGMRMKQLVDTLEINNAIQLPEGVFIDELAQSYHAIISGPIDFNLLEKDFNDPLLANVLSIIQDQVIGEKLFSLAKKISNGLQHIKHNSLLLAKDMENFEAITLDAKNYFEKIKNEINQLPTI